MSDKRVTMWQDRFASETECQAGLVQRYELTLKLLEHPAHTAAPNPTYTANRGTPPGRSVRVEGHHASTTKLRAALSAAQTLGEPYPCRPGT